MSTPADDELIVFVDETGRPIGSAPKLASHHAHTPRHLAFSCYVFNDAGQLLVTQRALSKKVWPGIWSNSFCGHPMPGEAMVDAITRRADTELAMKIRDLSCVLPDYRYTTPAFQGIIENEICPVYVAHIDGSFLPNPGEVEAATWMTWHDYLHALHQQPANYSYWAKDQAQKLANNPIIKKFTTGSV